MNQLTITESKLIKCFDRPSIRIRIKAKDKVPLVKNWVNAYESLNINQMLDQGLNWGLRTGKKIGSYYLVVLDLDDQWAKVRMNQKRYTQTSKGVHIYCLIQELPPNLILYNQVKQRIGELHSLGRQVVGFGSQHQSGIRYSLKGSNNIAWFLKFNTLNDLENFLAQKGIFLQKNHSKNCLRY